MDADRMIEPFEPWRDTAEAWIARHEARFPGAFAYLRAKYAPGPAEVERARAEGAKRERERIQAIEALDAPGHEDLINEMKWDPEATVDSVSRAIVERMAASRRRVQRDEDTN